MQSPERKVYLGTSNLVVPEANKSQYPEAYRDKSKLCYYASLFNSAEINSSFKKIPMKRTVERWVAETPAHFRFTFKMWKQVTHIKGLAFQAGDITNFIETINVAGDKKGCLLLQFPGKITNEYIEEFENLLAIINESDPSHGWKIAVEFRNASWYRSETYRMLKEYNAGLVFHDMPLAVKVFEAYETDFAYLRFHGPEKGYKGSYSNEVLQQYAQHIKRWEKAGKTVYVYFNNTLGDAVNNLLTMQSLI